MMSQTLSDPLLAWEFLRRNPAYRRECGQALSGPPVRTDPGRFPIRQQTERDRVAAKWGLHVYEHANVDGGATMPFWNIGPTLEAHIVENDATPFMPTLFRSSARLSGLSLLDGGFLLRIGQGLTEVQLRFARKFDPDARFGVVLRLPLGPSIPGLLAAAHDLWCLADGGCVKKAVFAVRRILQISCLPLMA